MWLCKLFAFILSIHTNKYYFSIYSLAKGYLCCASQRRGICFCFLFSFERVFTLCQVCVFWTLSDSNLTNYKKLYRWYFGSFSFLFFVSIPISKSRIFIGKLLNPYTFAQLQIYTWICSQAIWLIVALWTLNTRTPPRWWLQCYWIRIPTHIFSHLRTHTHWEVNASPSRSDLVQSSNSKSQLELNAST